MSIEAKISIKTYENLVLTKSAKFILDFELFVKIYYRMLSTKKASTYNEKENK